MALYTKARKIATEEFPDAFTVLKIDEEQYIVSWEDNEVEADFDGNHYDAMFHIQHSGIDFVINLTFQEDDETGEIIYPGFHIEFKKGNDWTEVVRGEPSTIYTE